MTLDSYNKSALIYCAAVVIVVGMVCATCSDVTRTTYNARHFCEDGGGELVELGSLTKCVDQGGP